MTQRAILCPHCRRLIGSQETVCSWCGTSRSNPWWRLVGMTRGSSAADWTVKALLTANIAYFALSLVLSAGIDGGGGFLSPGRASLFLLGATGTVPIDRYGRIWTLLSANYLHGGIIHLIFNLMALRQIAPWAANEYGASRMFVIYTLGGVCGYVVSYLVGIPFTIGASAALCSLIGSLLYFGRSRGGVYGSNVYREVSGWVISLFIFGLLFPGINNWAHGGGILGGMLCGKLLGYNDGKDEGALHHGLALLCTAATAAALGWALIGALR
jgi:rhomboid protease GluP